MCVDTMGMSVDLTLTVAPQTGPGQLSPNDAATYAEWFACLADPTRVRLLHAKDITPHGRERV